MSHLHNVFFGRSCSFPRVGDSRQAVYYNKNTAPEIQLFELTWERARWEQSFWSPDLIANRCFSSTAVPALLAPPGRVVPWSFIPFSGCQGAESVPCNPNSFLTLLYETQPACTRAQHLIRSSAVMPPHAKAFHFLQFTDYQGGIFLLQVSTSMPTSEKIVSISFVLDGQLVGYHPTSNWTSKVSPLNNPFQCSVFCSLCEADVYIVKVQNQRWWIPAQVMCRQQRVLEFFFLSMHLQGCRIIIT